jgi:hypothetical protein
MLALAFLERVAMDPLHATLDEFVAEGFTHVECHCPIEAVLLAIRIKRSAISLRSTASAWSKLVS